MLICTPIKEKTQKTALKQLKKLKNKVDLAEIWLDQVKDLDLKSLLKQAPLPFVCVCKKPAEKGAFKGTNANLAEMLQDSCKFGAKYVDIPLNMPKNLNKKIVQNAKKTKIIISHHDFKKTPTLKWMLKTAHEMKKRGADIVKIAVMARSLEDTFTVISLAQILQSEKIPHILIAMGKKGILTRIITPFLGGTIMFAPLKTPKATASGQLTVSELRKAWKLINI
jgi:3-dehydroquinate dehydratase type I